MDRLGRHCRNARRDRRARVVDVLDADRLTYPLSFGKRILPDANVASLFAVYGARRDDEAPQLKPDVVPHE